MKNVNGRVPPHDLDAEAAVLSAILLSREALDRVLEILKPEHFYSDANGRIYETAQALLLAGTPIDIVSVASYLRDRERLGQVGGSPYLAQLADATPAVAHVAAHASTVVEKWRLRTLIATCQRIAAEGYGDVGSVQEFIDGAEQDIFAIATAERKDTSASIGTLAREAIVAAAKVADKGDRIAGTATGFDRLDAVTSGMHPGELWIVAARPGFGKTSLAIGMGVNVAVPRTLRCPDGEDRQISDSGVCLFSQEMPNRQVGTRVVCAEGRVDVSKTRQGFLQPDDWRRMYETSQWLDGLPMWSDDKAGLTLLDLRAKVRRRMAEFNRDATATMPERRVRLVIVDYIQLMRGVGRSQNREQEVAEISRGLKEMAKELGVTVLALAQLNRAVETRGSKDKRPQLSDLRDSGQIEQDADTIIFIYRDEMYAKDSDAKGIAELLIAKQRNGPAPARAVVRFNASCTRFDNLAPGDYPEIDE